MDRRRLALAVPLSACVLLFASCQPPVARVDKVDISELLADWQKNPAAVVERHRGAAVEVVGFLESMDQTIAYQPYIIVGQKPKSRLGDISLQVFVEGPLREQLKDHQIGNKIAVRIVFDQGVGRSPRCTAAAIGNPFPPGSK